MTFFSFFLQPLKPAAFESSITYDFLEFQPRVLRVLTECACSVTTSRCSVFVFVYACHFTCLLGVFSAGTCHSVQLSLSLYTALFDALCTLVIAVTVKFGIS